MDRVITFMRVDINAIVSKKQAFSLEFKCEGVSISVTRKLLDKKFNQKFTLFVEFMKQDDDFIVEGGGKPPKRIKYPKKK